MNRTTAFLGLLLSALLSACTTLAAADAASDASDASVFETSAESAVPPLTDLDARADAGSDGG